MAPADLHVNTIEELHAKAVAEPGKLNYGTLGERTTTDAFRQWLNEHWKTNFVAIPYKGGGEIISALLENTIDVAKIGVGNMTSQLKEGKIKILALRASKRSPQLADVPTFDEAGFGALPGRADLLGRGGSRPARPHPSSSACTTNSWRSSADRSSPPSPTRISSSRLPARATISPRS